MKRSSCHSITHSLGRDHDKLVMISIAAGSMQRGHVQAEKGTWQSGNGQHYHRKPMPQDYAPTAKGT